MLGLDSLEVGNEGKAIMGVVKEKASDVLNLLRAASEGKDAELFGETAEEFRGVATQIVLDGKRIVATHVVHPFLGYARKRWNFKNSVGLGQLT
jgi:hydrogenase maturation factor